MKNNVLKKHSGYLFLGALLLIALLAFFVVKPFITSILTSGVLAYLLYPWYKKLNNYIKNKSFSSFIMVLFLLIILFIPTFFIINSLVKEVLPLYNYISSNELSLSPEISNVLNKIVQYVLKEASNLALTIPNFLLHTLITLFLFYYFLKDGEKLIQEIKSLIPLKEKHKNHVINEFKNVTHAIVYGLILVGLIIGASATLGFYIFKVPNPILWGLITIITSMLPGIGNWIVWLPASIIKIFQGNLLGGVGLLIYGLIFISGLEVFLKLKFIGDKSKIHPALIILGIFGGIQIMGFIGIFFGPLILTIFIKLLKSFLNESS